MPQQILNQATDFYLKSRDFNGLPIWQIKLPAEERKAKIKELVQKELLTINFGLSIFSAFSLEQHHINEMCKLMGRTPIFRNEYTGEKRPKEFSFLIRPTFKEFNLFSHLLDKMISDNIDQAFFKNDIPLESEEQRPDGKISVKHKGTIALLDEWLTKTIRFSDPAPKNEMIKTFREIRGLRRRPAHAIDEDVFDQKYFQEQRKLIINAYNAIRTLRKILNGHPKTRSYKLPDELLTGKIWTQ
ncbi:MAG: hypothetical protein A3A86_04875 [Elusimicrobia bacterium RIFCSPLOWO2_01_FULL_60_11]|nr:MAG: hypothetical protein A3A86_04875 [Elusimicrobia bacterium RIFCSPLOWO2_01_FULL_60_11]